MYEQEKIKPYKDGSPKREQVERMFDRIAHSYDCLNRLLSLGLDGRWRRVAVDSLSPFRPRRILDVATGTGDFAILSARRLSPQSVTGADISEGMMRIGRRKVEALHLGGVIRFRREDCEALSFADGTFDAVTVAYGVRNFEHLDRGLREMRRVLKRDGHLLLMELSAPRRFPMRQLFSAYAKVAMPLAGRLVSDDPDAYAYLPASMAAFPQGEAMRDILRAAGFRDVRLRRFAFGISTMYLATK